MIFLVLLPIALLWDLPASVWLSENASCLRPFAQTLSTSLGLPSLILLAFVIDRKRHKKKAITYSPLLYAELFTSLIVNSLKLSVGRLRPCLGVQENTAFAFFPFCGQNLCTSFPSGHTAAIFVYAVTFSYYLPQKRLLLYGIALFVSLSRLILLKHYLSDVLVGAYIGSSIALMVHTMLSSRYSPFLEEPYG